MGLISKTAIIKWHSTNKKHYEEKGYKFTKWKDEFEVKVEDLQDGCNSLVDATCDCPDCITPINNPIRWQDYNKCVHKNGKYYCHNCSMKLYGTENTKRTKLLNSESFYDWCYRNLSKEQADEIIARWDYELNKCSPKDILFSSNKKYWFKCPKDLHPSELKRVSDFTMGNKGSLDCKACNSIGQYLLDTYGKNGLRDYWDYEKNVDKNGDTINPFEISKSCDKKVYIFCQNPNKKHYHGSYKTRCANFTELNQRCPYCCNFQGNVHKYDSLGYLYPQVFDIWSEKNKKSPYEYSPKSDKKVYWKCLNDKHKDYKRSISNSTKYNFRCPECVGERDESILEEKTRLCLESLKYKVLHEERCSIVPINPKTKRQLPFDNEIILINEKHLICEVNGIQHYQICGFHYQQAKSKGTTKEQEFHKQQLHDRYKRFISYINGYEYLELPYWVFDKEDTYKKLIDDKISEILHKSTTKAS